MPNPALSKKVSNTVLSSIQYSKQGISLPSCRAIPQSFIPNDGLLGKNTLSDNFNTRNTFSGFLQ